MFGEMIDRVQDELVAQLNRPDLRHFPYDKVVAEFHRVGKHFVAKELLAALDAVRSRVDEHPDARLLGPFLDFTLDKWDGRYDYSTYLGLEMLPAPDGDAPESALARRDRIHLLLVTDALRFETAAFDGSAGTLPEMRPDRSLVVKRCRLGLRATRQELGPQRPADPELAADPIAAARRVCRLVEAETTAEERRYLELSMLPVYVSHDEYLFIRVLQAFETTFALIANLLQAVVGSLLRADGRSAAALLGSADSVLRRAAPLFSLLATMQVTSFRTFREFTEGASAIQSKNYKTVEALCRRPDPERLDSAAFRSVPDVRRRTLGGLPNVDEALLAVRAAGHLPEAVCDDVLAAMDRFAATLKQWRKTHYSLAVRMLGESRGTGYTKGTPYLKEVIDVPVFRSAGKRSYTD